MSMANSSTRMTFVFVATTIACSILFIIICFEIIIRLFFSVPSLSPRWEYSKEYGHVLYRNYKMVHQNPGEWKHVYTINNYGYRGNSIQISNNYEKKNIIVLGDSNAFGTGVNDGEEFPAILGKQLKEQFDVINLSVGGYGLTQQIRRFYEFGVLYKPSIVILQFSGNDPDDNLYSPVTTIENGRFVFVNIHRQEGVLKKYLSNSIVQKSQCYNYFRQIIYQYLKKQFIENIYKNSSLDVRRVNVYNDLLDLFAKDLKKQHITTIIISNCDESLESFSEINKKVHELYNDGIIHYVKINEWFEDRSEYPPSPEGHVWGKKAHQQLGMKLAEYISELQEGFPFPAQLSGNRSPSHLYPQKIKLVTRF